MRLHKIAIAVLATALWAADEVPKAKPAAPAKKGKAAELVARPKGGVSTPGIQIPATRLQFENEYSFAGGWIAGATPLLAPNAAKDQIERIDAKTFATGEAITGIAKPCGGAVIAFRDLWTISCGEKALLRLDAKTGKQIAKLATGASSANGILAASADSVWVLADDRTTLARVDPIENKVVSETRLPAGCGSLIFADSALWVACPSDDRVLRIDPLTNLVTKHMESKGMPVALAYGENSLWVLLKKEGKIDRVDVKTFKVQKTLELSTPNAGSAIVVGGGSIWVTGENFPLTRIDPTTDKERVAQQFWGEGGGGLVFAADSLWLTNEKKGTLWRVDPKRVLAILAD